MCCLARKHAYGGEEDGLKPEAVVGIKETTAGGGRSELPLPPPPAGLLPKGWREYSGLHSGNLWIYFTYRSGKEPIENI